MDDAQQDDAELKALSQALHQLYDPVLDEPLLPGTYRITVRDAVSVSRVTRSSERTFTRAKPAEKKGDAEPPAADAKAKAPAAAPVKPPATTPVKPATDGIRPRERTAP